MAIVVQTAPTVISVYEMKDGDVAVVVESGITKDVSVGTVVQRSGEGLILIGERSGVGYPIMFSGNYDKRTISNPMQVSKLSKGTTIML